MGRDMSQHVRPVFVRRRFYRRTDPHRPSTPQRGRLPTARPLRGSSGQDGVDRGFDLGVVAGGFAGCRTVGEESYTRAAAGEANSSRVAGVMDRGCLREPLARLASDG